MDETLLLIEITAADTTDRALFTTIWATTADLRAGHRLTRTEIVAGGAQLMKRLGELVPAICREGQMARRA